MYLDQKVTENLSSYNEQNKKRCPYGSSLETKRTQTATLLLYELLPSQSMQQRKKILYSN